MTGGHFLWIFALFCAGFLIVRKEPRTAAEAPAERAKSWQVLLCCAVLAATFWAELNVIRVAAETQQPFPPWFAGLPLLVIDENPPLHGHTPPWVGNDLALLAITQTVALYALYRALRRRQPTFGALAIIAVSCLFMLVAALSTRAIAAGADLYLNVGYSQLGLGAYSPPNKPFEGDFQVLNHLKGTPLAPAVYGPLWLLLARFAAWCAQTLGGQLQTFRILGALSFLGCLGVLAAMRTPLAVLGLFAVNPGLVFQYVVDAHNDITPLVFALCAVALARRHPAIALLCAVVAGAMKLPFALASAVAFSQLEDRKKRVAFALAAIVLSVIVTALLSRGAYFAALQNPLAFQGLSDPGDRLAHVLATAAVLATATLAIWSRRFIATGAWTFLSLGPLVLPWYLAWGVPYALIEGTFLPIYLFTLPLLAFDLSTTFGITPAMRLIYLAVVCTPLVLLLNRRRLSRAPA